MLPIVDRGKQTIGFPAVWREDVALKKKIVRMSNGCCAYCQSAVSSNHPGKRSAGQVEHFKPKSRFPTHAYRVENYFLGCAECNGRKSDKWPAGGYVQPDMGDPSRRFVFSDDGSVVAKPGDMQAKASRQDLGLDRFWLRKHRRDAIEAQLSSLRVTLEIVKQHKLKLSKKQEQALMVAPLSAFSAAINQSVRATLQRQRT